ncbi:MAG: TonB-dependent receptor, partial [Bacteroidota bacterium]
MKCFIRFCATVMAMMLCLQGSFAQTGVVKGKVKDPNNLPIRQVRISVDGTSIRGTTDQGGNFRLVMPAGKTYQIRFTHATHQTAVEEIYVADGRVYDRQVKMLIRSIDGVEIIGEKDPTSIDEETMLISPIELDKIVEMPSVAPSLEYFVKGMPGVASNSEFSSQYQVRGGNFDENLVYVNGIEIYRPFLARAGQQEGLGFSNPNMAQGLKFSTGGFSAQYGDRLSSVLDITYRDPKEFRGTIEAGPITNTLHLEGRSRNRKLPDRPGQFSYLIGARQFSTQYLLNTLDTQGEYKPNFLDLQGMFTFTPNMKPKEPKVKFNKEGEAVDTVYAPNERLKLTSFFALTRNRYLFEPDGRETTFGTIQRAFRLRVGFEGQEISTYTTGLGALMLTHQPNTRLRFDYILTAFRTQESELINVEGGYLLGEVNTNFGSDEFNEAEFDLGIGSEFRHARNYLTADIASAQFKGRWTSDNARTHRLSFGFKYQYQNINDELKEYTLLDSAGYIVNPQNEFGVEESIRGTVNLPSHQFKAFFQHEWKLRKDLTLVWGGRALYYDIIDEWMISPRAQLIFNAVEVDQEVKLRFRLAGGVYYQPPFYREFRRFDGSINLDIEPQRSVHAIVGMDYRFYAWGRPFRLFTEGYFKRLSNLIPYEVQNIRIRYYPDEVADGYAAGIDARINGEFIKGVDSWVSL